MIGTTDVAAMLGVSRQRVDQIIESYPDFPAADRVADRRVWKQAEVERWIEAHPERRPGRPRKRQRGDK